MAQEEVLNLSQKLILTQMFDQSMKLMQPTFETIISEDGTDEESFQSFLQEAKKEWLKMITKFLSQKEINSLVQSFFHTSQIDQQKLLMFNTVYTQKAVELAEAHLGA